MRRRGGVQLVIDRQFDRTDDPSRAASDVLQVAQSRIREFRWKRRVYWWAWAFLQTMTIVSAGIATIFAATDPNAIGNWGRAIPAAVATLTAAFMAAFHPRTIARAKGVAERDLVNETLRFLEHIPPYREGDNLTLQDVVARFAMRVEAITSAADDSSSAASATGDHSEEPED